MSTHARAATAAIPAAVRNPFRTRAPASALAVLCILLLSGCVSTERRLVAGNDPSDASAPVPGVRYRSTTASHVSQRPVAPAPWRPQNERAAPQPKSEQ
jgi:hypothetical protein